MAIESRVAIVGASGYIGGELLRLILQHPFFEPEILASRSYAGKKVCEVFPHLRGAADELQFEPLDPRRIAEKAEVCFLSLPHGESGRLVPELLKANDDLLIVDLSADFRLRSSKEYRAIYGAPHPAPDLLSEFIYALPEKYRKKLYHQKRLAAPGCFATAAILSLLPFEEEGLLPSSVTVSAVTGSSGSGSIPSAVTHHPERDGDFRAYSPLTHRHGAEIRQEITGTRALFVPHSAPMVRGIYATTGFRLKSAIPEHRLSALFEGYYDRSPFVRILSEPPRIKNVVTTNCCDIAVFTEGRDVTVLGALDNLVKGGAGQGIQAANVAVGLPETTGLEIVPAHP